MPAAWKAVQANVHAAINQPSERYSVGIAGSVESHRGRLGRIAEKQKTAPRAARYDPRRRVTEGDVANNFRIASEIKPDLGDRGALRWISHPPSTEAKQLTVVDVTFSLGNGHSFHKHPDQEEVIYVVSGELEQWLEREKRILGPGDAVFVPTGMVHALFQFGKSESRLLAIFGPCVGTHGLETIEVAGETAWKGLRAAP
jgi:quercetin dioxygenase-like cupin family protein